MGVTIHPVEFEGRDLPPFCVVTGHPTTTYVRWTARKKHPAWALLLLFLGVVPFLVYLLAASRSVSLALPATGAVQKRLAADRRTYWTLGVVGFALALAGVWIAAWTIAIGIVLMIAALALRFYLQGRDWIWAYVDGDGSVHIGGCSATFAAAVEAWRPAVRAT